MNCPMCAGSELKMSDRHGVEIDYCPKCRGVWLDRGELDKIIERASAEDEGPSAPPPPRAAAPSGYAPPQPPGAPMPPPGAYPPGYNPNHDSKYGYQYGYKKKKPIWKELFDF